MCLEDRRVVGARDFNGQDGRAGTALAIGDGISDRTVGFLADAEVLKGRAWVEAVGTIGVQCERAAVGARDGGAYVAALPFTCETASASPSGSLSFANTPF